LPAGIGRYHAGVHRKTFAFDQTRGHAAAHDFIEQPSEGRAGSEAAVAILGEGRMLRHSIVQVQPTKPAIGKVQVYLLAKPPFGSDPEAVADDEHADQ
jgi:hypothetical protein